MKLYSKSSAGRYRPATPSEVCEAASAYAFEAAARDRVKLPSPSAAREFVRHQGGLAREQFGAVYLDTRHCVLRVEILFTGTLDGASVFPREVVRAALAENAAALIIFHNHPSGNPEPSTADETITARLKDALALVDVRLLDHLIVGVDSCVSLAERGKI